MTFRCPSGHDSDESDYCSVCGVAMGAGGGPSVLTPPLGNTAPVTSAAAATGGACPVCGEPRTSDARFCEVCRYDFVARKAGPPPAAAAPPSPAPAPPPQPSVSPAPPPLGAASTGPRWRVVIMVDASLDTDPDPATPAPADQPQRVFPVEQDEMLIGRRDDRQQIRPAVALHDPGASRRHAKILRNSDGTVFLHDLGSTNGTKLNGADVVSGAVRPLADGDEITLGRWTRIRVEVAK